MLADGVEWKDVLASIGGILAGGAIFKFALDWRAARSGERLAVQQHEREARQGEIAELYRIIDRLKVEHAECNKQLADTRAENLTTRLEVERLRGDLRVMEIRMTRTEQVAGTETPGASVPFWVTCGIDGIVRECKGPVFPVLHVMASDMLRQPIQRWVPKRFLAKHQAGMAAIQAGGPLPSPDSPIFGFALRPDGSEVPVKIKLSGATVPGGDILISAEIQQRTVLPGEETAASAGGNPP